jgi:hypothetical protein
MKLRVKRLFKYTFDNVKTHKLLPGEYDVPNEVSEQAAILAIQFGNAVWVNIPLPVRKIMLKKEAPENKVVKPPENKVARPTGKKKKVRRKK